ncbi:hypothetical protein FF3_02465 [Fretibacterium fastidiosum]
MEKVEWSGRVRGCSVESLIIADASYNLVGDPPHLERAHQIVGGVVGYCVGTIENCSFKGTIDRMANGDSTMGGIVGQGGEIRNCRAQVVLGADSEFINTLDEDSHHYQTILGGIAGVNGDLIEGCLAEGSIRYVGSDDVVYAGGIVGRGKGGDVVQCVFSGDIGVGNTSWGETDAPSSAGGIAGLGDKNIRSCFARGKVANKLGVSGGLVGHLAHAQKLVRIENSSSACAVSSTSGLAGELAGTASTYGDKYQIVRCLWVSEGENPLGANSPKVELVSCDRVPSDADLPVTVALLPTQLGLTERKRGELSVELYPEVSSQIGNVTFAWSLRESEVGVLKLDEGKTATASMMGLKEGAAEVMAQCGPLVEENVSKPSCLVFVHRVLMEKLSLRPKTLVLRNKNHKENIRTLIDPDKNTVSYPPKWRIEVVAGNSAEADDIELTPADGGFGAAVALVRPVSGAEYRVVAEAVDGSGLSDDVIVTVNYVPPVPGSPDVPVPPVSPDVSPDVPAPVSPDVSPDIKPPLSPDVKPPVSPDITLPDVPDDPETGIAPKLPDGAPAGVGASKPAFYGGSENAALKNAAAALSDSGLKAKDLTFDPDTGVVRLQSRVAREVAREVLPKDVSLKKVRTLPVLSASLPKGATVAAVGLEITGADLMAKKASEVKLLKATGPDTGALLKWSGKPEEFGDGRFTVLDGSGRVVDELQPRSRYVLTVFIGDGGKYDLDGEANGKVVDPLALLSLTGGSAPEHQPGPDSKDGGGGGCNAGLGWLLLLAAAVPVVLRRRG